MLAEDSDDLPPASDPAQLDRLTRHEADAETTAVLSVRRRACVSTRREGSQEPNARSFDDVIRPQQQQRRDREAERLRRLEVDDQF